MKQAKRKKKEIKRREPGASDAHPRAKINSAFCPARAGGRGATGKGARARVAKRKTGNSEERRADAAAPAESRNRLVDSLRSRGLSLSGRDFAHSACRLPFKFLKWQLDTSLQSNSICGGRARARGGGLFPSRADKAAFRGPLILLFYTRISSPYPLLYLSLSL